jgi:DNA-binding transcriptional MerR regulator
LVRLKLDSPTYKAAEACKLAEVAPYVLRYWETEFPVLSEGKEKTPRVYTARDVRIISRIRELLYDEGFTVAGAKKRLEAEIAEGRFDNGDRSDSPRVEKKPLAAPVAERSAVDFLADSSPPPARPVKASPLGVSFPERARVIRELKEISQMLGKARNVSR